MPAANPAAPVGEADGSRPAAGKCSQFDFDHIREHYSKFEGFQAGSQSGAGHISDI